MLVLAHISRVLALIVKFELKLGGRQSEGTCLHPFGTQHASYLEETSQTLCHLSSVIRVVDHLLGLVIVAGPAGANQRFTNLDIDCLVGLTVNLPND